MCGWGRARTAGMAALLMLAVVAAAARAEPPLGKPLSAREIAAIDRDVRYDGAGLPAGSGTVAAGEDLYAEHCAGCHGEFAEGMGRTPALIGGEGTLTTDSPLRTIGSFWPYASMLFDYIHRAMPEGHAFSLSPPEVYALTAFLLNANGIVADDFVANAQTLPKVPMPNRDGFVMPPHPRAQGHRCMKNCRKEKQRIVAEAPARMEGVMVGDREEDQ